jgi:hypothetical protein
MQSPITVVCCIPCRLFHEKSTQYDGFGLSTGFANGLAITVNDE